MAKVDQSALAQQLAQKADNKPAVGTDLKGLLNSPAVKKRFEEILDKRSAQFMSSILNLVNADATLKVAEPMSVVSSCMVAATLDLPVDKNLGYAWIVPYKGRAQFQMGYRGYIQLALRTGQYRYINAIPIYEGELGSWNRLTEAIEIYENKRISDQIVGYCGYFELINGFKKTVYWTREQIELHRKKFSKSDFGWSKDYDAMALKTVLRNMLSKWGILSVEMQTAYSKEIDTKIEHGDEDTDEPIDIDFSVSTTEETPPTEPTAQTDEELFGDLFPPEQGGK